MSLVYKRMYVDIPTATHDKLVIEAAKRGMAQKVMVAQLIEDACKKSKPKPKRKVTKKKVIKRKPARRKR